MKIGDKVKFLKEVGGGKVAGFRDKYTVLVEDEDGFEIPVPVTDVVVEGGESYEGGTWGKPKQAEKAGSRDEEKAKPVMKPITAETQNETITASYVSERREGEKLNVFLGFIPTKPDDMVGTTFDTYIINDSNYFVTLTYLSAEGTSWRARFGGTIEPNTKEFVEEITRSQLDGIAHVALQLIAYKREKPFSLKPAISVELRIDGTKFYKAGAFKQSVFFEEPALTFDVVKDDAPSRTVFADAGQIREALMGRKAEERPKKRPATSAARVKNGNEIEVNLHAYALFDSTDGLTSADILNRQLLEVRSTMEKYKRDKGRRIIFIHGKGDGVLRKEVINELRHRYPACRTQDASFQEYGFGATLVIIE